MGRVDNKACIVTGAADGIGKASAKLLAKEGAKVAVMDIADEKGKKVVDEIKSSGGIAEFWHLDVTDARNISEAFSQVFETFKQINVLVNNAGIHGIAKPSDEIAEAEWQQIMDVDLKSVFLCTKHAAPYMKKSGSGSIINISSIFGLVGGEDPPYHAAKGGVRMLTKSDAWYYGKYNIRVNSIHPGYVLTSIVEGFTPEDPEEARKFRKELDDMTMLGNIGEPNDIAYGVVYLASDESKYMTGAELAIDGGFTAM